MLYVSDDYSSYKYLVEVSDNYVVLTNQRQVNGSWESPRSIDIIYQYINAPLTVIETEKEYYTAETFEQIETSSDFFDSPMYPQYSTNVIVFVIFIIFIINAVTKIVKKGGMFFGS